MLALTLVAVDANDLVKIVTLTLFLFRLKIIDVSWFYFNCNIFKWIKQLFSISTEANTVDLKASFSVTLIPLLLENVTLNILLLINTDSDQ